MAKRREKRLLAARINIPVEKQLKQRLNEEAAKYPGAPDPTKYARMILRQFVGKLPVG